jgi:hypothetical protein
MKELKKDTTNKLIAKELSELTLETQTYARKNHRYGMPYKEGYTPTHQLERATKGTYYKRGVSKFLLVRHTCKFYIEDNMLTVKNGKSYGVFIHEGTYDGYRKSRIAKKYQNTKGSKGWFSDPFLDNAIRIVFEKKRKKLLKKIAIESSKKFRENMIRRVR